jgi:regulator of sirC expression with transglutaminase-like and TPR domain
MKSFTRNLLFPVAVSFAILLGFLNVGRNGLLAAGPISHEKAVEAIEHLAKSEEVEGSYADMAMAASRLIDPALNDEALRGQIHQMAEAAANAWEAEETPVGKVAALSRVVFQTYGFSKPRGAAPVISGKGFREMYLLPGVLEGKRGFCEGLSTIYLLVAEQANLPVSIVNLPVHTLCRVDLGGREMYVECLSSGTLRSARSTETMNGVTPVAAESGAYLSPLTKKQFLNLHVNSLAYGLIKQTDGPKPLDMNQMVRLADAIQRLDPNRHESLETAALIHFKAGNVDHARKIIDRTVALAEKYGAPGWVLSHYRKMQHRYRDATPDPPSG